MMSNTLLVFSTVDGHTREICERLAGTLVRSGHCATLRSMDDGLDIDLSAFDRIVIGAALAACAVPALAGGSTGFEGLAESGGVDGDIKVTETMIPGALRP